MNLIKRKKGFKYIFRKKTKIEKFYYKNKEFIDYSFVSIICTLILYLLYFFITWITNGRYLIANLVAYIVSFTVLYIWDKKVFKSGPKSRKRKLYQLLNFILFRFIGFFIDSLILVLLIEKFHVINGVAKILSSLITFTFNYFTNKLFVFKKNKLI